MLKISNIETYYGNIMALKGVSLEVRDNYIFCILGANGAGKTTLLWTIAGLLVDQPEKGIIEFMGEEINGLDPHKIVKKGISLVHQGREIFPDLTVIENIKLGSYTQKESRAIKENINKVINYFPILNERKHQRAETLSGGEQQMLVIGRALMANPGLLLLDEPSLGLAPLAAKALFDIIKKIKIEEKKTILLVEQNAQLALSISDYGYVLENGRVVLDDKCEEMLKNEDVKEFYLGEKSYTKIKSYRRKKKW